MITLSINVTKLDKDAISKHKNGGKYLSLTLFDNKNGVDQYGHHGFVVQDLGKERRDAGERSQIIGNWKQVGGYIKEQRQHQQSNVGGYMNQPKGILQQEEEEEEIPF
jgi:hypothetical protein